MGFFMTTDLLTVEQFNRVLPPQMKTCVNQQLIDSVNKALSDPHTAEYMRDNILGYAHVMKEGKFKVQDYLNAVRYASYKIMGDTNIAAYTKTFPDRYQAYVDSGTTPKDIASYVTSYNKNKLVNLIMEQTMVPFHVFNQDARQLALQTQVELMQHSGSDKVRTDAANSVLTHTKPPETTKVEIDVGIKESPMLQDLRKATQELAASQRAKIVSGDMTSKEVAHSQIVSREEDIAEAEVISVTPEPAPEPDGSPLDSTDEETLVFNV